MKQLQRRLRRLERQADALLLSRPEQRSDDDDFVSWCRGGCHGPLPAAGPRPAKYASEEQWQQHHRFLLALCCRSVGRPDPPEMTESERGEVDETVAFFAAIDASGRLSLRQQADLAPYAGVLEQFLSDPGGGIVPP